MSSTSERSEVVDAKVIAVGIGGGGGGCTTLRDATVGLMGDIGGGGRSSKMSSRLGGGGGGRSSISIGGGGKRSVSDAAPTEHPHSPQNFAVTSSCTEHEMHTIHADGAASGSPFDCTFVDDVSAPLNVVFGAEIVFSAAWTTAFVGRLGMTDGVDPAAVDGADGAEDGGGTGVVLSEEGETGRVDNASITTPEGVGDTRGRAVSGGAARSSSCGSGVSFGTAGKGSASSVSVSSISKPSRSITSVVCASASSSQIGGGGGGERAADVGAGSGTDIGDPGTDAGVAIDTAGKGVGTGPRRAGLSDRSGAAHRIVDIGRCSCST